MNIVSNQNRVTHLSAIKKLLSGADEVIICSAFLKMTGLNSILKMLHSKVGKCTFYIGTDYYLTEPEALRRLYQQNHSVFIVKKSNSTFHPKIYYFRTKDKISVVVGSANLTGGGLETNFEVSAYIETGKQSSVDKQFRSVIKNYAENSTRITELEISQYARQYEIYKNKQRKAQKEFEAEIRKIHDFDLSKIDKYLKEYKNSGAIKDFEYRKEYYIQAKRLLNRLSRTDISSSNQFLEHYDEIAKSFYSSGLLRGKKTFARRYKTIVAIIKLVQQNRTMKAPVLFGKALPLVHSIKRYGINGLTELMNTYNPQRYSVANGRTIKSLAKLRFKKFPTANNFKVETYEEYNSLIKAIAERCNFENLGQVDHFLSYYYSKHVKKKSAEQ